MLPFFREGLANGEHCIYIAHEQSVDDWLLEFQAYGIDVEGQLEKGSLAVVMAEDWRKAGDFSSIARAREFWQVIEERLGGFSGVRIAGDAGWALDPPLDPDKLCPGRPPPI